jgi:tRNA A-37 threonylcarbamoyl transferase component Bud32
MQGFTELDDKGNRVRIIDFIKGPSILEYIYSIEKDHEQYFREDLPAILWKLTSCIQAIQRLHDQGTCHGDIRNDHILIDTDTKEYRWIDFDLHQHVSDFDVWSAGNILGYVVGKGINSFHQTLRSDEFTDSVKHSLTSADASAFYEYRVINLRKLYPYVPRRLNDILMRFSAKTKRPYSTIAHLLEDYREMLEANFDSGRGPAKNGMNASTVARQRDENP